MKIIKNAISLIRAHITCCLLKFFNQSRFSYNALIRLHNDVDLHMDRKSQICIGKDVVVGSNTVVCAIKGGKLTIGNHVGINSNSMIVCHQEICIGDGTMMGPGVYIYDHDHVFTPYEGVKRTEYKHSPIIIGKNCWIGAGSMILRGSVIGDNCVIGAGSIIKGSYPKGSLIVQKRNTEVIKLL